MTRFSLAIFVSLVMIASAINPAQATTKQYTYAVYAGGIYVLDATLDVTIDHDRYDIGMSATTHGLLKRIVPWTGIYRSQGQYTGDSFAPQRHEVSDIWKDSVDLTRFSFKDDTLENLRFFNDGVETQEAIAIPPEFATGVSDLLTTAANVLLQAQINADKAMLDDTASCDYSHITFDGKRRFDMVFTQTARDTLKASKYNIYDGDALRCTIEIFPMGGKWRKKPRGWQAIQEQGRKKGSLPTVWIGHAENSDIAIPVKLRVKTDFGTFLMHLKSIQSKEPS